VKQPKDLGGALDLGYREVKSGRLRVVYVIERPAKGLAAAVLRACKVGTTPLFLLPKGRTLGDEGVREVELSLEEHRWLLVPK